MAPSGQLTSSALQALIQDGNLAGSWTLDTARSEVRLKSRSMWGLAPVKGVFREVTGNGTVSAAGDVTGTITVAARSVDTKNKKRDEHLRSADFFDTANHPEITFAVRSAKAGAGDTVEVSGQLTVRGISRPQNLTARLAGADADALTLDTEFTVDRAEFGLGWNQLGMIRGLTTVAATLRFVRTPA